MHEMSTVLILLAVPATVLLVHALLGCLRGGPGSPGDWRDAFGSGAPERVAVEPDGSVLLRARSGETVAFHRNELRCVRGRDLVGGLCEVVIDLFERRIVLEVSSKTAQRDIVLKLAR